MNQELLEKLRILQTQFADGSTPPDGTEINNLMWRFADCNRAFRAIGQQLAPPSVLDAVRHLLEGRSVALAFDPWAGLGVLAATVHEAAKSARTIAYSRNEDEVTLGKAICPQLDWHVGDAVAAIESIQESIDVAASVLPFGMQAPTAVELRGPAGETVSAGKDHAQALLAIASMRLSEDGVGLFVVTPNFFFSANSIFPDLYRLGLGVEAALALPAGSFGPQTNLAAYLVVVRRKQFERIFVAQLSQDSVTNRQIVANLRAGSVDGALEMGRFVPTTAFCGLESLRVSEQLDEIVARFGAPVVQLAELATNIEIGSPKGNFEFNSFDNSVFIPLIGESDVVTSLDAVTLKRHNYAQVAIDPARSHVQFVARFLNSELGRSIRSAQKSGSTLPKLNTLGIRQLSVVVPPRDTQQAVLQVASRLALEQSTVLGLQNEISDLDRKLWDDPPKRDEVEQRLKTLAARLASGATSHAAATLEQWFETLPFPLASILRAWQATQSQDYKSKQDHLLHFFEATAEFLGVICLSAFASREEIYAPHRGQIVAAWTKQNLTLQRATFGTWKVAVEYLAKQIRTLLAGEPDDKATCRELFGDPTLALPRMLANTQLVEILSATNKMRNDWSGHSGVVSQPEAQLRNEKLVTQLQKLREAMAGGWSNVHLVRALHCQNRRGVFENEVAVMTGSNSEFLKESRSMSLCLDVEHLYLAGRESGRPLQLLPFIHVGPSPTSAKNACYFFNRVEKDGIRFLSYHFVDQPERHVQADDTSAAIRFLSDLGA